jgi:hypothetical protein
MANLSEEEALALVAVRGHCDDVAQWKRVPGHEGAWEIQSGILDEFGLRCDQFVRLGYMQSSTARPHTHFQFTLFLNTTFEYQRIYQLEIHGGNRSCKNKHQLAHEHIGSSRYLGPACWDNWDFESVLAHFCYRTNIYFKPVPHGPTVATRENNHAGRHR